MFIWLIIYIKKIYPVRIYLISTIQGQSRQEIETFCLRIFSLWEWKHLFWYQKSSPKLKSLIVEERSNLFTYILSFQLFILWLDTGLGNIWKEILSINIIYFSFWLNYIYIFKLCYFCTETFFDINVQFKEKLTVKKD